MKKIFKKPYQTLTRNIDNLKRNEEKTKETTKWSYTEYVHNENAMSTAAVIGLRTEFKDLYSKIHGYVADGKDDGEVDGEDSDEQVAAGVVAV